MYQVPILCIEKDLKRSAGMFDTRSIINLLASVYELARYLEGEGCNITPVEELNWRVNLARWKNHPASLCFYGQCLIDELDERNSLSGKENIDGMTRESYIAYFGSAIKKFSDDDGSKYQKPAWTNDPLSILAHRLYYDGGVPVPLLQGMSWTVYMEDVPEFSVGDRVYWRNFGSLKTGTITALAGSIATVHADSNGYRWTVLLKNLERLENHGAISQEERRDMHVLRMFPMRLRKACRIGGYNGRATCGGNPPTARDWPQDAAGRHGGRFGGIRTEPAARHP